jgi:hypothetical protein
VVNLVHAPIAVHNLHGGPEKSRWRRRRTIRTFLKASEGGLGSFNELNPADRMYLRQKAACRGLQTFIHKSNGAVWDPELIQVQKKRVRRIMRGGHVGADGVPTRRRGDDDRRVGPNRYALYLSCKILPIDFEFEWVITHLMARSFTKHRWRIPLFRKSVRELTEGIRRPNGILVGDMNSISYLKLPDVLETPERTPETFGNKRYDQILRWGPHIDVIRISEVRTKSDHDMLTGIVKFYRHPRRR